MKKYKETAEVCVLMSYFLECSILKNNHQYKINISYIPFFGSKFKMQWAFYSWCKFLLGSEVFIGNA